MNKTLGQIAYEAYCAMSNWKSLVSGAPLPKWHDVTPEIKSAWEAAGQTAGEAAIAEANANRSYQSEIDREERENAHRKKGEFA